MEPLQEIYRRIEEICHSRRESTSQCIAEVLGIGNSTAYKKTKFKVSTTAEELFKLAEAFGISLDEAIPGNHTGVRFDMPSLLQENRRPREFLEGLARQMSVFGGKESGMKVLYATNEVPVFYYFLFPELTAFKLLIWEKTAWNPSSEATFRSILADKTLAALRDNLLLAFLNIPSKEFYPINILDNTLNQIGFARTTGDINAATEKILYRQMGQLSKWLEKSAKNAVKTLPNEAVGAEFDLFYNEIMFTNNLILVENSQKSAVFSTMDNPNFIRTEDPRAVNRLREWFGAMHAKSQHISGGSEKVRRHFFGGLDGRVRKFQGE